MDGQLVNQVIANTKALKAMQNQRRSTIVRKYGEEHDAGFVGNTATFYFPVDTDMEYISELQIKLVIGTINGSGSTAGGQAIPIDPGTGTYKTMAQWLAAIPVGSYVDMDKHFGAQCWDYADAFWVSQVNRTLKTGSHHSAADAWRENSVHNAGTAFTRITQKSDIKKGDWVITGESQVSAYGHIFLAAEDYNSSHPNSILGYGQNQGGTPIPAGGAAVNLTSLNISNFLGAFRYTHWTVN